MSQRRREGEGDEEVDIRGELERSRRRSDGNSQRLLDLTEEFHKIANRLHLLEDKFEEGGVIQELSESLYLISEEIERLKIKLKEYVEGVKHGPSNNTS